jgi:hypothetical protein
MLEGSVLLPSLNRPSLLFTARFAVDLAPVERIADSLPATAYADLEDIRFSVNARSIINGRLQNVYVIRQSSRRKCRLQSNLKESSKPCGTYL